MRDVVWVGAIDAECTDHLPVAVVETRVFSDSAEAILDEEEVAELKIRLAINPEQGDLVKGGGGVRKLRWAVGNRGKSHGARIIYYYHCDDMPIFLLYVYRKGNQENLAAGELKLIRQAVKTLVSEYGYS